MLAGHSAPWDDTISVEFTYRLQQRGSVSRPLSTLERHSISVGFTYSL